eukprot:scaffold305_cov247-Pinguiococcus_pyrenoidosus.AAC.1
MFAPLDAIPLPDFDVKVALLVASDRASAGAYDDKSGPAMAAALAEVSSKYVVVQTDVIPDEPDQIQAKIKEVADGGVADLLLTSGGTGFGPRDRSAAPGKRRVRPFAREDAIALRGSRRQNIGAFPQRDSGLRDARKFQGVKGWGSSLCPLSESRILSTSAEHEEA